MGLRSKIGALVHGDAEVRHALDSLSADLRTLQARVDGLSSTLDGEIEALRTRQLAEFDGMREAMITVTDDLSARIAALRHDAQPSP